MKGMLVGVDGPASHWPSRALLPCRCQLYAICWVLGISCTLRDFINLPCHCPITQPLAHSIRTTARPLAYLLLLSYTCRSTAAGRTPQPLPPDCKPNSTGLQSCQRFTPPSSNTLLRPADHLHPLTAPHSTMLSLCNCCLSRLSCGATAGLLRVSCALRLAITLHRATMPARNVRLYILCHRHTKQSQPCTSALPLQTVCRLLRVWAVPSHTKQSQHPSSLRRSAMGMCWYR